MGQRCVENDDNQVSGNVTDVTDLEAERVHVGCETPGKNFGRGDPSGGGIRGAFGEDVRGGLQGAKVDREEDVVDVD